MGLRRRFIVFALVVGIICSLSGVCGAWGGTWDDGAATEGFEKLPKRPQPERLINDFTGVLTPEQAAVLERRCVAFADSTSNQIAVVIVPTFYGMDKAEYAYRIGATWGVGQGKYNNGVVILIKPKTEREFGDIFIAVGTGLEPVLTDALTRRIIEQRMIPAFKEGDYYRAISDALDVIFPVASGEISSSEFAGKGDDASIVIGFIIMIIVIVVIVALCSKGSSGGKGGGLNRVANALFWLSLFGRGGRGGGGGFGGFGGGHFGGGGAGSRW